MRQGWSGGVMVLGNPPIWMIVGQGRRLYGHFYSPHLFSPLPPSLWETEILSQRAIKPKTTHQMRPLIITISSGSMLFASSTISFPFWQVK